MWFADRGVDVITIALVDTYFPDEDLDPMNRWIFALAGYNAGATRISRLRRQAAADGLDPNAAKPAVEAAVTAFPQAQVQTNAEFRSSQEDQINQLLVAVNALLGLAIVIAVLGIGVIFAFWQVFRLNPEIRWVNAFRIADPGLSISHQPRLLAPMATLLRDRTGAISLSTASMSSIMDSLSSLTSRPDAY